MIAGILLTIRVIAEERQTARDSEADQRGQIAGKFLGAFGFSRS